MVIIMKALLEKLNPRRGERESVLRDVEDDFHLKESQSASWQMSPWRRLVSVKKLLSLLLMYTLIWMIFFFFP